MRCSVHSILGRDSHSSSYSTCAASARTGLTPRIAQRGTATAMGRRPIVVPTRRHVPDTGCGSASVPAAADHRPQRRSRTSRWPTRTARSRSSSTARSTTSRSCASELIGARPPVPLALRHETIVHLYEDEGDRRAIRRLDGMFALAIWDGRAAAPGARARSGRQEAALRLPGRAAARLCLGDQVVFRASRTFRSRSIQRACRPISASAMCPSPATFYRGVAQLAAGTRC